MNIVPTNLNAIIEVVKPETDSNTQNVKSDGFIIPVNANPTKTPTAKLIAVSDDCTDTVIKNAVGKNILYRIDTAAEIPDTKLAIIAIDNIVAILSE